MVCSYEIYTINGDGSDERRLTFTPRAIEANAAFSSDGTKIAFDRASRRLGSPDVWNRSMWIMNADGTGERRLADVTGHPAWSPSGARIAFIKDGDLYTIKTDGTGLRRVASAPRTYEGSPNWSPDGTKIIFEYHTRHVTALYTINADGSLSLIRRGTFMAGPAFSPDGTKITYSGSETGVRNVQVFSLNADGSGTPTPLTSDGGNLYPDWGPA